MAVSLSQAPPLRELKTPEDIARTADSNGRVSLVGFGSLLSERSARSTFARLEGFSAARLHGFRRVFCHAAPIFFERGIAMSETREISSLSVEPCDCCSIVVSFFAIPRDEIPLFVEREHEFRFLEVPPDLFTPLRKAPVPGSLALPPSPSVICSRYSDEEYRKVRLKGDAAEYERRYGRWGIQKVWDDTLFPCRIYLRHCVLAAKNLGEEAYESFLDETFLADRTTTIRQHLQSDPRIMEDQPPPSLQERYGG